MTTGAQLSVTAEGPRVFWVPTEHDRESARELIEAELAKHNLKWTKLTGSSQHRDTIVERFTSGEVPMVLSYTTSPAYHMVAEDTDRYQAAVFAEGHYMQIEVAAALSGSAEPDLAGAFLTYLQSDEVQAQIPLTNWMYPVNAPEGGLPAGFADPASVKIPLLLTPDEAAAVRDAAIEEVRDYSKQMHAALDANRKLDLPPEKKG